MNRSSALIAAVLCLLSVAFLAVQAQVSSVVLRVNTPVVSQNQPLPISVEFTPSAGVERVMLRYRQFGQSEYTQQEMLLAGNSASLTISAQYVLPPYLEYYVLVELAGGRSETYPIENADASPLKATIKPVDPKSLEVRVLSPEQGETVASEDLVIAVSLYYASEAVDRKATKLFLNGVDVTSKALYSDDVLLFSPANFPGQLGLGVQFLRVELYDKQGSLYTSVESNFSLSTAEAIAAQEARLRMGLNGQAEYRNEDIASITNTFTRLQLGANGAFRSLNFGGNLFLTNEEKSDRQPQNRYSAFADLDFLKVQVGDAYPKFPTNIVSGKRVRGVAANLFLKFFNVDFAYGQTTRNIDGLYLRDTSFTVDGTSGGKVDSSKLNARPINTLLKSGFTYALFQPGTFTRNFFAIRPSFGSGENFQWGFTYMNAKDDIGSIKYGVTPQQNLVAGTDMVIAFDDQKFRLEGQAELSLTNTDITNGSFTQADYDLMAGKNDATLTAQQKSDRQKTADDIKKIADVGSKFMTINQYLFPLNPVGTGLPGVAYEGILTLNYFNNFIRGQVYQRGQAYTSFGNEFLQNDINGLALSDRIRMFSNRALLSLAYEQRKDNTAKSKPATTTYGNINGSLTVFPASNFPSFTVGYGTLSRKSDANLKDTLQQLYAADDVTGRVSVQMNYDFDAGARHNLSIGVNLSDKTDNLPSGLNHGNQKNNSYFGSLTTFWRFPLQSTISFNSNLTQSDAVPLLSILLQQIKLSTYALNLQYRLFNDKVRLAGTLNTSTGDLNRTLIQGALDYTISANLTAMFQYDYIQNSGIKDDNIISAIARFNF
ncbi:MAG TPA: hypothetical protein VMM37_06195 [Bacteroidota bacterium]|nr:hypothetical protein [Bacteroidota bacterium]